MDITEILTDIYHLNFPTQQGLASTFLRFQEHYESPQFREKIFSLDEFQRWYTANSTNGRKTGEFTYYEDWEGFNFPSYVLDPFYRGLFDPLSKLEKLFLEHFEDKTKTKFYVIGTFGKESALKHEIAHGLFYIDEKYKTKALRILATMDPEDRTKISNHLRDGAGYHTEVIDDEMHAYLTTDRDYFTDESLTIKNLSTIHHQLRKIFDKYVEKHKK